MNQPKLKVPGTGTPQSKAESKSHELPSGTAMAVGAQIAATPDAELPDLKVGRMAHTPGPWTILGPSNRPYADYALVGSDQAGVIAGVTAQPEAEANAALIAAAPDLLARVRLAEQIIRNGETDPEILELARCKMADTIAKAEGRSR